MSLALTGIDNFVVLAEAWGMPSRAWNPLTGFPGKGCAVGVKQCWAARRQKSFEPTYWPERAEKIRHIRKPSIVVCNYMGEPFSSNYRVPMPGGKFAPPFRYENTYCIEDVLWYQRLVACSQHTYFWLSKHPERYADFDWPDGTCLGTTVNTPDELRRIDALIYHKLRHPQHHIYVYLEPLLGDWWEEDSTGRYLRMHMPGIIPKKAPKLPAKELLKLKLWHPSTKFNWVIIGGKSRNTLPEVEIHKESVAAVVATCELLGIPVFCKRNLELVFKDEFDSLPREVPKR